MSKENFKSFVAKNPNFVKHVNTGNTSWQKLYELYDLYGENSDIWDQYRSYKTNKSSETSLGFKDIIKTFKNIDMDNVQKNISSLQKAVDFLGDFAGGSAASKVSNIDEKIYNPRPLNKFFDD